MKIIWNWFLKEFKKSKISNNCNNKKMKRLLKKFTASKRKPCPQPSNGTQNMIRISQGLKPIDPDGKVISQD